MLLGGRMMSLSWHVRRKWLDFDGRFRSECLANHRFLRILGISTFECYDPKPILERRERRNSISKLVAWSISCAPYFTAYPNEILEVFFFSFLHAFRIHKRWGTLKPTVFNNEHYPKSRMFIREPVVKARPTALSIHQLVYPKHCA